MELFLQYMLAVSKFALIVLSIIIIVRCIRSMLSERYEPEVWGYIRVGRENVPVCHWENTIGRSGGADIRVDRPGVGRIHAVLKRSDAGIWTIYDVFAKGGVWVNGIRVGGGLEVQHGDVINLAGNCVRFLDISPEKQEKLEKARTQVGKRVSPSITLVELTLFELFLLAEHMMTAAANCVLGIGVAFAALILMQWLCYNSMRIIDRSGFEVETLAFYLTSLGVSVAVSSTPEDMYKHILLMLASLLLFLMGGWWLRSMRRTEAVRIPAAVLALALLALNVLTSEEVFGARNWLQFGGYSFQPSEFVKVAYVYVGASTLDRLYRRRNLFSFILFSAACVIALALIGDFGTALVFFVCFLIISFMRSGSIATVFLAVTGAGLAGFLAVSVKPYIAQRFASWGHVWEDVYDKGYQQTRAMSAAASGGLFGKGAGAGWLKDVFAANTDMVFAVICEELGLIIAVCMVLAVLTLAFFAVRTARHGRSSYHAIAACSAMAILLTQLSLNVFGSLDILPFTGVTFPFVSRGGSSLLSCWMLMSFIKGADNRKGSSFAVRSGRVTAEERERAQYMERSRDYLYSRPQDDDDEEDCK